MTSPRRDVMAEWIDQHPWTLLYIALMVTAQVILQVVQLLR